MPDEFDVAAARKRARPIPAGATIGAPIPAGATIGAPDVKWDQDVEKPDKWDRYIDWDASQPGDIFDRADTLTRQTEAAAARAGVSKPGVEPIPNKLIRPVGLLSSGLNPSAGDQLAMREWRAQETAAGRPPRLGEFPPIATGGEMMLADLLLSGFGLRGMLRAGIRPALSSLARTTLKTAAGSEAGRYIGGRIGGMFGEDAQERGAQIGSLVGGLGGSLVPNRYYSKLPFGFGRMILSNEELAAERTAMKMAQRASDESAGFREPTDPVAAAVRARTADWLPTKIEPPAQSPLAGLPSTSLGEIRSLPTLSEGAPTGTGPTTGTNPRYQLAGPLTLARPGAGLEPSSDVLRIPEPRPALPTDRPGAMYSVPREQLPGLAAQGTPGAGDVLRNTGKTILYEPPSGYPGPRVSQGATRIVLPAAPSADTLADAIVQRSGMDRPSAERRAEELLNAISGKNFTSAERASARNQIRNLVGIRPAAD